MTYFSEWKALHFLEQVRSRCGRHGRGVLQAATEGGYIQAGQFLIFLEYSQPDLNDSVFAVLQSFKTSYFLLPILTKRIS